MSRNIVDAITHDHRELQEFYDNILNAKDNDTKVRWQNQFVWELARHSVAEEIVVYPAFEKYIENGKVMADDDRSQHNEVNTRFPNGIAIAIADFFSSFFRSNSSSNASKI